MLLQFFDRTTFVEVRWKVKECTNKISGANKLRVHVFSRHTACAELKHYSLRTGFELARVS